MAATYRNPNTYYAGQLLWYWLEIIGAGYVPVEVLDTRQHTVEIKLLTARETFWTRKRFLMEKYVE